MTGRLTRERERLRTKRADPAYRAREKRRNRLRMRQARAEHVKYGRFAGWENWRVPA
jgi:hypothetical protein